MNPNVSSSSLSDVSELRYQKAIKEISKLINMNNTTKREAENYKLMYENLQNQNRQIYENYHQIEKEKESLEEKVSNL